MGRFDHIWQHYFPNRQSPEQYVEKYLLHLEKLDRKKFEFWRDYQSYLAGQRELRHDAITDSLNVAASKNMELSGYRIVTSNYGNDPLCTHGSIVDAGRFNFGSISEVYRDFDCLYLGDSPATCFQEKFHYLPASAD